MSEPKFNIGDKVTFEEDGDLIHGEVVDFYDHKYGRIIEIRQTRVWNCLEEEVTLDEDYSDV